MTARKTQRAPETPARGASATTVNTRAQLAAWWYHHLDSAQDSLRRQRQAPLQHLLTALVIGITLAMPTLFAIAIDNLQQLGERWDSAPRLSVFAQKSATAETVTQLQQRLRADAAVRTVQQITPEQGLAAFEQSAGLSGTLELLEENPLPFVLAVELHEHIGPTQLHTLQQTWQQLPAVDTVQADLAWVQKLFHMMQIGERITIALAALLGAGALLSVGNTIRLAIENRRAEIVVAKLVGATDAFVRRPFLYSGFWYGLTGGLVAVLLVTVGYHSLVGPAAELARLYASDFSLHGLNIVTACGLMSVGIALGMFGAWLAVGQHLYDMRPR